MTDYGTSSGYTTKTPQWPTPTKAMPSDAAIERMAYKSVVPDDDLPADELAALEAEAGWGAFG